MPWIQIEGGSRYEESRTVAEHSGSVTPNHGGMKGYSVVTVVGAMIHVERLGRWHWEARVLGALTTLANTATTEAQAKDSVEKAAELLFDLVAEAP